MFIELKLKKILPILSRIILCLLIVGGILSALFLFSQNDVNYSISGLIIVAFLGIITIILLLGNLTQRQPKQQISQDKVLYFLTLFFLVLFLTLFISSYGLYGLWFLLFKVLSTVYLIGLVFLFAVILTFFLKDLGYVVTFCVPILLYPFILINHSKTYLALGAILGGVILGNIIVTYLNNDFSKQGMKREFIKQIFRGNFKIFVLTFIVSLILFFVLGNDSYALFSPTINFNEKSLLINLSAFIIFIILLVFQLKPLIVFLLTIIIQTITAFISNLWAVGSSYNFISFLLFQQNEILTNLSLYLYSYCLAIVWFMILLVLASFKTMYCQFMTNLAVIHYLNDKFNKIGVLVNYQYKYLFYQKTWIDLLTYHNQSKTLITNLLNDENSINPRFVQTTVIYQLYYQTLQILLPFSINLLWALFWTSNGFEITMLTTYWWFLKGAWVFYFLIILLTLFIFFPNVQDYFFRNWWSWLVYRIKLTLFSTTKKGKARQTRKKWNQNRKK
ncbi:hypothetical protein S100390_v1c04200 [Spiroplasma sp. NBRC 100390]|uniref:hypothetical protein n=1 Tax=unclassified Spiroplasma TaxID=2637901 RepID=UPI0008928F99|nr:MULTISPECIES: hypothetical protein [unclassified Spiroplasma]AOX43763.1 hypothetical protein STU14_v1c04200 [Spiroplasma sp. TU-14]APE13233.1 hypothetical protein S100390_v1c04200 [Spiroplasma sp. NBRC 100390]